MSEPSVCGACKELEIAVTDAVFGSQFMVNAPVKYVTLNAKGSKHLGRHEGDVID
jgi:hypothetical protein